MDDDLMIPEDLIVAFMIGEALFAFIQMVFRLEKEKKNGNKIED